MSITRDDAIKQAMAVGRDLAEGRLSPADLETQAVAELEALMLVVPEPGSSLEALQIESARRVLARGDLPATEVAEWAAVARRREGIPAVGSETLPQPISSVLSDLGAESNAHTAEPELDPEPAMPEPEVQQSARPPAPHPAFPPNSVASRIFGDM